MNSIVELYLQSHVTYKKQNAGVKTTLKHYSIVKHWDNTEGRRGKKGKRGRGEGLYLQNSKIKKKNQGIKKKLIKKPEIEQSRFGRLAILRHLLQ